jgi:drug/metabolite transporter (DMT)-like permease
MNLQASRSTEQDGRKARTLGLTVAALVCFASNSLLCRYALVEFDTDAVTFTVVRLVAGAITLFPLVRVVQSPPRRANHGSWMSALMLFVYAGCFSLAYLQLTAATGALVLFAGVQASMILGGLLSGERPLPSQWIGLSIAMAGLTYLLSPGVEAPQPAAVLLMLLAGIAWGIYSLRGRGTSDPLQATADNFLRAVVWTLPWAIFSLGDAKISVPGLVLSVISGAAASGIGYVLWYGAVRGLTATAAAAVQLAVPVLAAIGGVILLSESVSLRLFLSSIAVLGGIGLAVIGKRKR